MTTTKKTMQGLMEREKCTSIHPKVAFCPNRLGQTVQPSHQQKKKQQQNFSQ